MSITPASAEPQIEFLEKSDYDEWSRLFHAYIAFYGTSLPDEQYENTFARLLDEKSDLYGLVMRDAEDSKKLIGLAHFFPHQTAWSEKKIMHLNDLFIDPNVRAKGYGKKMIMAVKEKAKEQDCLRLGWVTKHENPARKLYDQVAACDFVQYRLKLDSGDMS